MRAAKMPAELVQPQSNPSASHDHHAGKAKWKHQLSSGSLSTSSDTDPHDLVAHLLRAANSSKRPHVDHHSDHLQDILDAHAPHAGWHLQDFDMQELRNAVPRMQKTEPDLRTPPPRIVANMTYTSLGRACFAAGQTDASPSHGHEGTARPAAGDPLFSQTRTAARRTPKLPQLPVKNIGSPVVPGTPPGVVVDLDHCSTRSSHPTGCASLGPLVRLSSAHPPASPNPASPNPAASDALDDADVAPSLPAPGPEKTATRRVLNAQERRLEDRAWRTAEKRRREIHGEEIEAGRPARLEKDIRELALLFESARDSGAVTDVTPAAKASSGKLYALSAKP